MLNGHGNRLDSLKPLRPQGGETDRVQGLKSDLAGHCFGSQGEDVLPGHSISLESFESQGEGDRQGLLFCDREQSFSVLGKQGFGAHGLRSPNGLLLRAPVQGFSSDLAGHGFGEQGDEVLPGQGI